MRGQGSGGYVGGETIESFVRKGSTLDVPASSEIVMRAISRRRELRKVRWPTRVPGYIVPAFAQLRPFIGQVDDLPRRSNSANVAAGQPPEEHHTCCGIGIAGNGWPSCARLAARDRLLVAVPRRHPSLS